MRLSLYALLLTLILPINAAVNLEQFGISIALTDITNHEHGITLATPQGIKIQGSAHKHVKLPLAQPIEIKGINGKKSFTKARIQMCDDQHAAGTFFYTSDPTKQILPTILMTVGFRYPCVAHVIPGTLKDAGHIDLAFYKPNNAIKMIIDAHGKGHLTVSRHGNWVALLKHTDCDHPCKSFTIKELLTPQRTLIYSWDHKHTKQQIADEHLIDTLIMHKVDKVEIDYKKKSISLITK